jgi:hypothetical protein
MMPQPAVNRISLKRKKTNQTMAQEMARISSPATIRAILFGARRCRGWFAGQPDDLLFSLASSFRRQIANIDEETMEHPADNHDALYEAVVFLCHFRGPAGPAPERQGLVLLLCLLAMLAGAEAITDMARSGEKKLDLLRRFRPFADGTPAHDHLGDILAALDAEAFQRCFVA